MINNKLQQYIIAILLIPQFMLAGTAFAHDFGVKGRPETLAPQVALTQKDVRDGFLANVRESREMVLYRIEAELTKKAAAVESGRNSTLLKSHIADIMAELSGYENPLRVWSGLMSLRGQAPDPLIFDETELWKILHPGNARFFWYGKFDEYERYIPEIVEAKRRRFYPGLSHDELQAQAFLPMAEVGVNRDFNSPYQPRGARADSKVTNFDRRGMDEFDILFNFRVTANISARVARGEQPRILVLGAGRGKLSYDLWKRYRDKVEIHSVNKEKDIDGLIYDVPGLIETIRRKRNVVRDEPPVSSAVAEQAFQAIRKHFVAADVHRLHFPDQYFDIVIVPNGTFIYFANKLQALEELRRVLKPEGDGFAADIEYFHILDIGFAPFFNGISEETFVARWQQADKMIFSLHFRNTNPSFQIPLELADSQELPSAYILGMIMNRFKMIQSKKRVLPGAALPEIRQAHFKQLETDYAKEADVIIRAQIGINQSI